MIAMAITCNPNLIFADEPTSSLDVTVQSQIIKLFNEIQDELNTAIVFITHDLELISIISDFILVMYAGQMMEFMTAAEQFENSACSGRFTPRPAYRPLTKFEQRGERLGHGVWDLIFRRR